MSLKYLKILILISFLLIIFPGSTLDLTLFLNLIIAFYQSITFIFYEPSILLEFIFYFPFLMVYSFYLFLLNDKRLNLEMMVIHIYFVLNIIETKHITNPYFYIPFSIYLFLCLVFVFKVIKNTKND